MMGWSENFIAVLLSIVAVALMAVSGSLWRDGGPVLVEHAAKISPAPGCWEDDPRGCVGGVWVCWRDGNKLCGVLPQTKGMMYISGMPTERGAK